MRRLPLQLTLVGLSLLGMLLMASRAWPQSPESIGRVTAVEGKATVLRKGQFAPAPLVLQERAFPEDIIETDVASKVRITLTDGTVISLGAQTRLELKQFRHDARQLTRIARFIISSGVFRATVKKLMPQSTFEVTTPTAVAAIRGTDLMGEVTANSTAVVVLEGAVMISNVHPRFPGTITLTQGTGTTVIADRPPGEPAQWSESRIEALLKAITIQ